MLRLAPIMLIGYALTMHLQPVRKPADVSAPVIEVQTCERGAGLVAKASAAGLFGFGLQYGVPLYTGERASATFSPKMGLSYASENYRELPMRGQFEVGAQLLLGWNQFRVGVEYWHLSNAGLQQPNIGLDMLILQTGLVF